MLLLVYLEPFQLQKEAKGVSGCWMPPPVWLRGGRGQPAEGREAPGAERGDLVSVRLAAAAREPSWAVVRAGARWAEAEAGVQAEEAGTGERISYTRGHATQTATTCHSWPPFRGHGILPVDRPGGEWCWNKQEEKAGGGTWGPGEQPSPRPCLVSLTWDKIDEGALRQG